MKKPGVFLLAAALAIALTGCGDEGPPPAKLAPPTPTATVVAAVSTLSPAPMPTPVRTATPGPTATVAPTVAALAQDFRANLGAEPSSLDPQLATSLLEWSVIRQVFQGLLGFRPDLSLEPVVATAVPSVENGGISPDGLTYTFTLRHDATWSDGRGVTAHDFVFALRRLFDPELAAPFSYLYGAIAGALSYAGAREADAATRQALGDAVGVEAAGDLTLRIRLEHPDSAFLQKMAMVNAFPVRRDVVEAFGSAWTEPGNYIGNGPYVLTEWVHQDHITLEANPNYWGPPPGMERITYRMIGDPNTEFAAFRNDELELSRVPPGTEASVLADPPPRSVVVRTVDLFTFGLFFNTAEAPFDNVKVRQAFATAIDRDAWVQQVTGGVGQPATGWLPPGMPGYDPDVGGEYALDADRAQRLLAEAGYPGGRGFPPVVYTFVAVGGEGFVAEFIQAQIRANLGVSIELEPLDPPAYFQQVMGGRQFQMTGVGWNADYPDPENFLAGLFMTGSPNNIANYSSPEFDRLAGMAMGELDQARRLDLWAQAHRVLSADAPVAPFFHQERLFLVKSRVRGLTPTAVDGAVPGDTRLAGVTLAP